MGRKKGEVRYTEEDLVMFRNKKGEYEYNKLCVKCGKDCKQSYQAVVVACKKRNK